VHILRSFFILRQKLIDSVKGGRYMPNIFNVANYVLQRLGDMTTMKLQKLVYYCQAWSLAWDEIPLFDEDFQAWANGPVCPELFNEHRNRFVLSKDYFKDYEYDFFKEQIETMESVISHYGDKEPLWLSDLTHQEAPWRDARHGLPAGEPSQTIISKESMQQYYAGL